MDTYNSRDVSDDEIRRFVAAVHGVLDVKFSGRPEVFPFARDMDGDLMSSLHSDGDIERGVLTICTTDPLDWEVACLLAGVSASELRIKPISDHVVSAMDGKVVAMVRGEVRTLMIWYAGDLPVIVYPDWLLTDVMMRPGMIQALIWFLPYRNRGAERKAYLEARSKEIASNRAIIDAFKAGMKHALTERAAVIMDWGSDES